MSLAEHPPHLFNSTQTSPFEPTTIRVVMYDEALLQVVNPDDEVYCVANSFPAISLVPVVKRILYEVEFERLDDGVTVKVLSELDADGVEDI